MKLSCEYGILSVSYTHLAKLNLQLDKNYSGAFYKEAGADKTDSNEKDYAGKASYAAGTYLALSSAGGSSDSQNFYLVMGGVPNGNLSNAQTVSYTHLDVYKRQA